jgi:hypothetical protein
VPPFALRASPAASTGDREREESRERHTQPVRERSSAPVAEEEERKLVAARGRGPVAEK